MSDTTDTKQENQKTVVAFIAGLLIGGLLVWVFSAAPADNVPTSDDITNDVDTEEVDDTAQMDPDTDGTSSQSETTFTDKEPDTETGDSTLSASDQAAGTRVELGTVTFPTNAGWIVVRDYTDGQTGNILGAARFNVAEGLTPDSVGLLRATVSGSTYQVVFHSDNGDHLFSATSDQRIEGSASATFEAE